MGRGLNLSCTKLWKKTTLGDSLLGSVYITAQEDKTYYLTPRLDFFHFSLSVFLIPSNIKKLFLHFL